MPIEIKIECDKCLNDIDEFLGNSAAKVIDMRVAEIFDGEIIMSERVNRVLCPNCAEEEAASEAEKAEREAADDVVYQEYCYRRDRF